MALVSTAVGVTSGGTTVFAADAFNYGQRLLVSNNNGTVCFLGGGTTLASGGGTSGGLPLSSANTTALSLTLEPGESLFGITTAGTADMRVLLMYGSR